jgi:adenosine deaminase
VFLEAGVKVALCCDNSTVSQTNAVRESALAAREVGIDAVEAIHRSANEFSFIRPEATLPTRSSP